MSLLLQPLFMFEFNEYFSNQFVEYFYRYTRYL